MNRIDNKQVDILLSTYNGSKYLRELIDSIINQTYPNWQLIIRDDGSSDDTINIIQDFIKQLPEKIIYIEDQYNNLGPSQSFSKLMEYSSANYLMFCDQDDVWLENKIEITITEMLVLEAKYPNRPFLVHTDLTVVDRELNIISNSFWSYQKLNPKLKNLNNVLIQNIVTGCTIMINKRLKELAQPIPKDAIIHDWWIALVASIHSGIYEIKTPLILYRQHNENNIGAKKYNLYYFINKYRKLHEPSDTIKRVIKQSNILLDRYNSELNSQQYELLDSFNNLLNKNRLSRLIDIFIYRFRKHGLYRNIGWIVLLVSLKKNHEK